MHRGQPAPTSAKACPRRAKEEVLLGSMSCLGCYRQGHCVPNISGGGGSCWGGAGGAAFWAAGAGTGGGAWAAPASGVALSTSSTGSPEFKQGSQSTEPQHSTLDLQRIETLRAWNTGQWHPRHGPDLSSKWKGLG